VVKMYDLTKGNQPAIVEDFMSIEELRQRRIELSRNLVNTLDCCRIEKSS
jgi:hypothetical protein